MTTIGLLHGMSPSATVDYYARINEALSPPSTHSHRTEIVIFAVDFAYIKHCVQSDRWDLAVEYLVPCARRLEKAGVDVIALGSSTIHRVIGPIRDSVAVPVVDIIDTVATAAISSGTKTVGVLGTLPITQSGFYLDRLATHGITALCANHEDQEETDRIVFDELSVGMTDPGSRSRLLRMMHELAARGAEAIVLASTEISQLVKAGDFDACPIIDATAVHIEAIVAAARHDHPLSTAPYPPSTQRIPNGHFSSTHSDKEL